MLQTAFLYPRNPQLPSGNILHLLYQNDDIKSMIFHPSKIFFIILHRIFSFFYVLGFIFWVGRV